MRWAPDFIECSFHFYKFNRFSVKLGVKSRYSERFLDRYININQPFQYF